jgi:hypothetical protein
MRVLAGISFIVLLSGAALCQSGAKKPAFDIADVHVSPRSDWVKTPAHSLQGGFLSGDRYELRRATMLDLIRTAYNVDADKVYGGPSWLDYDRFGIVAKTKPGTRAETLRAMLQTLIEDRFELKVKADTRGVPGYALSKGKQARAEADSGGRRIGYGRMPVSASDARRPDVVLHHSMPQRNDGRICADASPDGCMGAQESPGGEFDRPGRRLGYRFPGNCSDPYGC